MNFPLFHRPGTIALLDDDYDYLEMLALVLPRSWNLALFAKPATFIAHLQQEPPFWEADAWAQQQIVDGWRQGKPLVPRILDYWSQSTERFALSRVCLVDYSMPGMNGLQVLSALDAWQGLRVLLTGQADEQIAVRAFNQRLIHQYIPKQSPAIADLLVDTVRRLMHTASERHAQIWRSTLNQRQYATLGDPAVDAWLSAWCDARWVEHVLIGDPFGVLGMDAAGKVGWLQLETRNGVQELAELAREAGVPDALVAQVRAGARLVSLELQQELGSAAPWAEAAAFPVGGEASGLVGALFPLEGGGAPGAGSSYGAWLARQPRRAIRE